MKHKIGFRKLSKTPSHRKALFRNMVTSLFRYERIRTTRAKALEARRFAEKLITRAKEDTVHDRRVAARFIQDKEMLAKLFTDIGVRFRSRSGGYTRILKLGRRPGDAAEMVILELVDRRTEKKAPRKRKPEAQEGSDDAAKDQKDVAAEAVESGDAPEVS